MSIRKRTYANGHTVYVADVRVDGQRRRGNFDTKSEAMEAEARWRTELKNGPYRHGKIPSMTEWIEQVIQDYVNDGEHRNAERTEWYMRTFQKEFGNVPVNKVTTDDVSTFLARLKREGRDGAGPQAASTNNVWRSWLSRVFSLALKHGIIDRNPVKGTSAYSTDYREKYLKPAEVHALVEACHPCIEPWVMLAVHTGMRRSAIQTLEWRDIDLLHRTITVRAEHNKSGKRQEIKMTADLHDYLTELRDHGPATGRVCRRMDGEPYASFPGHWWRRALEDSGLADRDEDRLEGFRFHDLRHTAATIMLQAGVGISMVSDILGHSSITITKARYAHITDEMRDEAADKFQQALGRRNAAGSSQTRKVVRFG